MTRPGKHIAALIQDETVVLSVMRAKSHHLNPKIKQFIAGDSISDRVPHSNLRTDPLPG
jgi:hypothetical protein